MPGDNNKRCALSKRTYGSGGALQPSARPSAYRSRCKCRGLMSRQTCHSLSARQMRSAERHNGDSLYHERAGLGVSPERSSFFRVVPRALDDGLDLRKFSLRFNNRSSEGTGICHHLVVEGNESCFDALGNRDIDRIGRPES